MPWQSPSSFCWLAWGLKELGVPLANEKTEGPVQYLTFLGLEIDTVSQTSRLPMAKLVTLKSMIEEFMVKCKVTLREFQQLVGHLNFACKVVAPGRAFLRTLCTTMADIRAHDIGSTLGLACEQILSCGRNF